jgi:hypothetical protein
MFVVREASEDIGETLECLMELVHFVIHCSKMEST